MLVMFPQGLGDQLRMAGIGDTIQDHTLDLHFGVEALEAMHHGRNAAGRRRGVQHQDNWQRQQLRDLRAAALFAFAADPVK